MSQKPRVYTSILKTLQAAFTFRPEHAILLGLILLFVVRRAWVGDDAFITLRSVDNWLNGYGLTFNVSERVQAYTHPLWMLLLSLFYFFTREPYFTTLFICILCSGVAVALLLRRIAVSPLAAVLAGLVLLFSNAFIDWSTSGLENPLSFLLLAVFVIKYSVSFAQPTPKDLLHLSLIASLAVTNRMDTGVLYLPMLALAWWRSTDRKAGVGALALGQTPFILWSLFALLYYGFMLPNTYYAKLHTGLGNAEVYAQGLMYYVDSLRFDPLTLTAILAALGLSAGTLRRSRWMPLGVGILLYLLYIVSIGGDFMSGRFFSLPLFAAAILLAQLPAAAHPQPARLGMAAILLLGLFGPLPTFTMTDEAIRDLELRNTRITNERLWYDDTSGLLLQTRISTHPYYQGRLTGEEFRRMAGDGRLVLFENAIGMEGFYAGPNVHIIDLNALSEPFLARLPMVYDYRWRPAHYIRYELIPGYYETVVTGTNQLEDSGLRTYYGYLSQLIHDDLWSMERLRTIINMNLGRFDYLIDTFAYTYPELVSRNYSQVNDAQRLPFACTLSRGTEFRENGVLIRLGEQASHASSLTLALNNDREFAVQFLNQREQVGYLEWALATSEGVLYEQHFAVPPQARLQGFDEVLILPLQGDGPYCLAYMLLEE